MIVFHCGLLHVFAGEGEPLTIHSATRPCVTDEVVNKVSDHQDSTVNPTSTFHSLRRAMSLYETNIVPMDNASAPFNKIFSLIRLVAYTVATDEVVNKIYTYIEYV